MAQPHGHPVVTPPAWTGRTARAEPLHVQPAQHHPQGRAAVSGRSCCPALIWAQGLGGDPEMLWGRSQTLRCPVIAPACSGCTPRQCPPVPPSPAVSPQQSFLPLHPPRFAGPKANPAPTDLGKPNFSKEGNPIPSPAERLPTSLPLKQKQDPCKKLPHIPGQ